MKKVIDGKRYTTSGLKPIISGKTFVRVPHNFRIYKTRDGNTFMTYLDGREEKFYSNKIPVIRKALEDIEADHQVFMDAGIPISDP